MDRLFLEGASERRRFLDRLVYGFEAGHARRVTRYETAMRERARLLRYGPRDPAWLDALEEQMTEATSNYGRLVESGEYSGQEAPAVITKMIADAEERGIGKGEVQWRLIWEYVCRARNIDYDARGVDYVLEKWMRPHKRPMRMCQPRDIADQMISIAKYNMERVTFSPDLIDAACATYFISTQKRDFGAMVTGS